MQQNIKSICNSHYLFCRITTINLKRLKSLKGLRSLKGLKSLRSLTSLEGLKSPDKSGFTLRFDLKGFQFAGFERVLQSKHLPEYFSRYKNAHKWLNIFLLFKHFFPVKCFPSYHFIYTCSLMLYRCNLDVI